MFLYSSALVCVIRLLYSHFSQIRPSAFPTVPLFFDPAVCSFLLQPRKNETAPPSYLEIAFLCWNVTHVDSRNLTMPCGGIEALRPLAKGYTRRLR